VICFLEQPSDCTFGPFADNQWKITTAPWNCKWEYRGAARRLYVPARTVYDGASSPWWCWTLSKILPDGLDRAASLAHDQLYRTAGGRINPQGVCLTTMQGNPTTIDRAEADWVLGEFMRFAGISRLRAWAAWAAVRTCGAGGWGTEDKDKPKPWEADIG
jgi:hypothetical protein